MTLTVGQANRIYDILVREAGADNREYSRECFILSVTDPGFREYRFCGSLGFGGKFRNDQRKWQVSTHVEDLNNDREETMRTTNAALTHLQVSYLPGAEVLS